MPSIAAFDLLVALVAVAALFYLRKYTSKHNPGMPYPPGPRGLPLIGNIYDMPKDMTPQEAYLMMSRKYDSDIIHLKMLTTDLLIVNSQEAANELFDRRSALYSDRPIQPMVTDLVQLNWFSGLMRYGELWRSHRRVHHKNFRPKDTTEFEKKQLKAIHELLRRMVHNPHDLFAHVRLMMGSLLLSITYGVEPKTVEHPYILLAETTIGVAATAGTPGAFMVDVFPWLKYLPEWAPGAGFIKKAKYWKKVTNDCVEEPFKHVKDLVEKGEAPSSVTAAALQAMDEGKDNGAEEEILKGVTAMVYAAGADTTISVINTIVLALLLNPDAQRKAHDELSRFMGKANRLPDFDDIASLPYCVAIVREALRWRPTAPISIPHRLMSDDVYNGMFMPGGSIVIGNAWGMLRDDRVWPEPKKFRPERFLTPWGELDRSVKNTEDIAFGFGRRHCPGRPIAISTLYALTATIIATVEIVPSLDEKGKPIIPNPDIEFTPGLVSSPVPFKCEFKPRSQHSLDLINEAILSHAP